MCPMLFDSENSADIINDIMGGSFTGVFKTFYNPPSMASTPGGAKRIAAVIICSWIVLGSFP